MIKFVTTNHLNLPVKIIIMKVFRETAVVAK